MKPTFLSPLFLSPLSWHQVGVQHYVLDASLRYYSRILGRVIEVKAGFNTDAESCPRWLPIINSLFGNIADQPAVVHDWLYFTSEVSRKKADQVLLEAMCVVGIPAWRRQGVYWGLRIGGWAAWNAHRQLGHPPYSPGQP